MTVGSDNPFPSVLMHEHVDPSNPAAGYQRLFVDTDHLFKMVDSAGTVTTFSAGAALATDTLWDAAGDLVQGSGANTAAKLSAGTAGKVLTSNGAAAALTWETPAASGAMATDVLWDAAGDLAQGTGANTGAKLSAGTAGQFLKSGGAAAANAWASRELDYVQVTSGGVTINQTAEASAVTIVTGSAVVYDGSTIVMIEFFSPDVDFDSTTAGDIMQFWLYDGSSSIGWIGIAQQAVSNQFRQAVHLMTRITPSAATHTYSIRATVTNASRTAAVSGGAGGAGNRAPMFIRITRAV